MKKSEREGGLTKDDDGDVDGAEDAELVGFFEEAILALEREKESV